MSARQVPEWLAPMQQGLQYHAASRWQQAAAAYESALALGLPPQYSFQVRSNLGLALMQLHRSEEALESFDAVLREKPDYADGHHNRGNVLYKMARFSDALRAFEQAVELVPTDAGSWFNLGNAADKLAEHGLAVKAFRNVLSHDPSDAEAAYNLANALKAEGATAEAIEWYTKALRSTPNDANKHANLAYTLDAAARHAEAARSFENAIALDTSDASNYIGLGHALKSTGEMAKAAEAYRHALQLVPHSAAAYTGLGSALKDSDPQAAADAFACASAADESQLEQARAIEAWLDANPPPVGKQPPASPTYPSVFEEAPRCASMPMDEAVAAGADALLRRGPTKLSNATHGWQAREWTDAELLRAVGDGPLQMLAMPHAVHPTLDVQHDALVEPALHGVFFKDYLALLDRLASSAEFAVYLAQLNLLKLPKLLAHVCLPAALPASKLTMVNVWVGGELMKNGLHFDQYDNLLFQIAGSKRALIFPPDDAGNLYYSESNIRRHQMNVSNANPFDGSTEHERVRHNVAKLNIFASDIATTHPKVASAKAMICELNAGEALFIPRGWHHAVISHAPEKRNLAVNTWYDVHGKTIPLERASSLGDLFQSKGC